MADIKITLDTSEISELIESVKDLDKMLTEEAGKLAAQAHAHVIEQAQNKLRTRRQKFLDNLAFQQINQETWMITVKDPAVWIEDGLPAHSMVDDLLGENAKTAKDGSKYRVIPFEHSKGPTQQTTAQQSLTSTIKETLKQMKVPYGSIERDAKGRPKQGLLHKFDINDNPIRQNEGLGQGKGPVGSVMQGNTGIPLLSGVRIYQRALFNSDGTPKINKKGQQQAIRSIMTFRTVSSKHRGDKWNYPGIEAAHFLEECETWIKDQWESVVDDLLKRIGIQTG